MKKIFSFFLLMTTMLFVSGNAWAVTRPANDAASLNDAIAAAETGDVVQLTADVDLGATTLQIDKAGVEFTLDLNGHNLTGSNVAYNTGGIIRMQHGTLTVKTSSQTGGSIGVLGESQYVLNVSSNGGTELHNGKVILESGSIRGKNNVVNLSAGSGTFVMNGGEVLAEGTGTVNAVNHAMETCSAIINDGKIYAKSSAAARGVATTAAGGVVINGGSITGETTNSNSYVYSVCGGTSYFVSIRGGYFNAIGGKSAQTTDLSYAKNITGGKFAKTPNLTYLDEGYTTRTISETIDGVTYTTEVIPTEDKYFAIGGTQYVGLQDAIDAANDGDVIKLIKSTTNAVQKEYFFPAGKSLTLDLNGLTLDRTGLTSGSISPGSTDHSAFNVFGNLTIVDQVGDGVIKCPTPGGIVVKGGALTLESGKIEADVTASSGYARSIMLNSGSAFTMNGGELSAKISGSASTCYALHIAAGATATINGGKIYAESQIDNKTIDAIMCAGIVTVNDVEMCIRNTRTSTNALAFVGNSTGTQVINGGKFVVDGSTTSSDGLFTNNTKIFGGLFNSNVQTWVPLGEPYMCQANGGLGTCYELALTHEVVKNSAATAYICNVTQGDKDYTSISTAFAEAADNDELRVLQDMDLGVASLVIDKPITFDVNGHNISASSTVFKLTGGVDAAHTLVLTDKAVEKGLIDAGAPIQLVGGYVTVDNVKVKATTSHCFYEPTNAGNFTIQNVVATTTATTSAAATVYNGNSKKSTVAISNCTFTLDASTLTLTTSSSSYPSVCKLGSGTLSIDGGTYKVINTNATNSKYAGIFNGTSAKISINDGMFRVEGAATTKYLSKATTSGTIPNVKISGGTFDIDPRMWLADGYVVDENSAEGIYGVLKGGLASVDGEVYDVMSEAIEAAAKTSSNHIVTLLHSAVLSSTLTIPAGVTFDGNGFTIELAANTPLRLADGATTPTCITNTNFVASIPVNNATYYFYSLDKAVSACGSTQTVKLLKDIADAPRINISSGTKTIDFNGHSLTSSNDRMLFVKGMITGSATVNFINSSSTESVLDCTNTDLQSEGLHVETEGARVNVTVGHGVTIKGSYGATVWKGVVLNVYGKIVGKRVFAVGGNGQAQYAGTTINIYDGAEVIGAGSGIYHPQEGTLNIYGGTITGLIALGVKAGTVNIYDGTLHATGECNRQSGWSNGIEASGAAIQLESNKSYAAHVNLNITGGNFISDNCYAFYEYVAKNSEHSSTEGVLFNGGKFTGDVQISQDMAYSAGGFITGGNYSHDVVAFCKENYTTIKHIENGVWDGTYDVVLRQNDDKTKIEAATPNQEVEMPATTETSQVTISGDVTVSTVDQETEVQKIVLGPGADLVVKDGTTLNVGAGGIHIEDVEGFPATVTVEAGGTLTVDGLIYNSTTTNFVIESSEDKIGTLLISPQTEVIGEDHPNGTFYFTSKAKYANGKYTWQRFGVPTADGTVNVTWTNADGTPSTAKTAMYAYDYSIGTMGDWVPVGTGRSGELTFDTPFTPFQCYDMTINENQPNTVYAFAGAFMGNQNASFNMVNGWNYLANSYLAPIDLESFLTDVKDEYGDNVSATVYIYRSSDDKWDHVSLADFEGWFSEPAQTKINPMQSFILKLMNGNNVEGGIDYENNVYNPIVNASASAPKRSARLVAQSVNIEVSNGVESDMVRLVEGQEFSADFDNGYDAPKYMGGLNFAIYAISTDGELADVATDNIEGTELVFNAQTSGVYTLTFSHVNGDYVLRDLANNAQVVMINGATYSFAASAGATAPRFVVEKAPRIVTGVDQVEATQTLGIYSITGQYLGSDWTAIPAGVYVVNGVKMIK